MEKIISLPWRIKAAEDNEATLIKKAVNGDSDAFVSLIKNYKVDLYKIAYSYVKNEEIALEIIQETTYKGLMAIVKLKNPEFFKTWITRILINVAIDYKKKEDKTVTLDDEVKAVASIDILKLEEKVDLYEAIDKLKDKYKMAIILKYFEDRSIEEIGYLMDIPENTVKSHLRRGKEAIRGLLKEGYLDEQ